MKLTDLKSAASVSRGVPELFLARLDRQRAATSGGTEGGSRADEVPDSEAGMLMSGCWLMPSCLGRRV